MCRSKSEALHYWCSVSCEGARCAPSVPLHGDSRASPRGPDLTLLKNSLWTSFGNVNWWLYLSGKLAFAGKCLYTVQVRTSPPYQRPTLVRHFPSCGCPRRDLQLSDPWDRDGEGCKSHQFLPPHWETAFLITWSCAHLPNYCPLLC